MLSLFENCNTSPTPSICIRILHDNTLTQDNREKFICIAERYNKLVKFYNVEENFKDKITDIENKLSDFCKEHFGIASIYRILIPQILSTDIDKVIYLDSDVVVNLDISELYHISLYDKPLGAIPEELNGVAPYGVFDVCKRGYVNDKEYFNSGVLLMNLKVLRKEEKLLRHGIDIINSIPDDKFFDQDLLNYCFSSRSLQLSLKFNRFVRFAREDNEQDIKRNIYHYCGKLLSLGTDDPFNRLWMDYFIKTPWFDSSVIGSLYNQIKECNVEFSKKHRKTLIKFSAELVGKTRVFVVSIESDINKLKNWVNKTYLVQENEEIFIYAGEESLQKLIDEMNSFRGKKIFLIKVPPLIELLKEAGFVEEEDFFDHYDLFSPKLLKQKESYSLIMSM